MMLLESLLYKMCFQYSCLTLVFGCRTLASEQIGFRLPLLLEKIFVYILFNNLENF